MLKDFKDIHYYTTVNDILNPSDTGEINKYKLEKIFEKIDNSHVDPYNYKIKNIDKTFEKLKNININIQKKESIKVGFKRISDLIALKNQSPSIRIILQGPYKQFNINTKKFISSGNSSNDITFVLDNNSSIIVKDKDGNIKTNNNELLLYSDIIRLENTVGFGTVINHVFNRIYEYGFK